MKKAKALLILSLMPGSLCEQQKTAESTELYAPVPPVVTPGEYANSPSDAIILFNGSNLDQWTGDSGGPVAWRRG